MAVSLLSFGLVVTASAHLPPGVVKYIFQFPDHLIPKMDGDISDWEIVPDEYWVKAENMINQFAAPINLSDWNARYAWGWNPTTNRLYFGGWISDDMRHGTEHWSIEIDADHSADQYWPDFEGFTAEENQRWHNASNQKWDFGYPRAKPLKVNGNATWAMEVPTWVEWGVKWLQGVPDDFEGPDIVTQEAAITPWDDLNPAGPEVSKMHILKQDEIIGIEVNSGDKDPDPGAYDDAYWSTSGGVNAWKFADQFGDWYLAPVDPNLLKTAVGSETWGRIKATFVK